MSNFPVLLAISRHLGKSLTLRRVVYLLFAALLGCVKWQGKNSPLFLFTNKILAARIRLLWIQERGYFAIVKLCGITDDAVDIVILFVNL